MVSFLCSCQGYAEPRSMCISSNASRPWRSSFKSLLQSEPFLLGARADQPGLHTTPSWEPW